MRNKVKSSVAIALSAMMVFTALSTAPDADAASKTKKITLSATKKTLTVGAKFTLKVKKVKPAKANKKVTWKSNKKAIATVSKSGVVKAKKAGTAKITATSKSNKKVKATCTVKVKEKSKVNNVQKPVQTPIATPPAVPSNTPAATPEVPATTVPTPVPTPSITLPEDSLKENAAFNVGTVINYDKTQDVNFTALAKQQFDVVSFENEMKGYSLLDTEASMAGDGTPVCKFEQADGMVEWAIANGLKVRGHVLIWEASMAESFFHIDYDKEKGLVDKETLLKRMESYEMQVITHFESKYPGTVIAWDVVNEAIDTDSKTKVDETTGLHLYTTGKFYQIIGGDYIKYAFEYANKAVAATGADIQLFYNDFNCFQAPKTDYIKELIKYLNADPANPLLDCMGMEGYVLFEWPGPNPVKQAMEAFADCGVKVGINELCVRLNDQLASGKTVSEKDIAAHAEMYKKMFTAYCTFAQEHPNTLTNVSIWALFDRPDLIGNTEHYDYGVYGTHSGLFTAEFEPKQAFFNVCLLYTSPSPRDR